MKRDYTEQIAEYWPIIMRARHDFADLCPVIECDIAKRQVLAWCARKYISSLSERTREAARRQYRGATAVGGIMIFIKDSKNRVLRSQVYVPDDKPTPKFKQSRKTKRPARRLEAGGPT